MISSFHIIGSRQMGGAEKFFMRLVLALKEREQPVTAVIRPTSPLASTLPHKITRIQVPMRNGWDILSVISIKRLIRAHRPAIVQTYMGRATRLTRIPHDTDAVHVARLGGYYKIKSYYEHAHAWVGNTKGLCDYLIRNGMPSDRVYCIGNFVEIPMPLGQGPREELRSFLDLPNGAIVLFSLGRFNNKKAFDTLLQAFALLPESVASRSLVMLLAGDGPLAKNLRRQALDLGIDRRIRWLGWQDNPGIYYDLADIFICPSRVETLGNVILEAWAHGLPVISTKTPGALELIRDQENGLLVPIDDFRALAATIFQLVNSGISVWNELGKKGLEEVKRKHTKVAIVEAYLNMYEEVRKKAHLS